MRFPGWRFFRPGSDPSRRSVAGPWPARAIMRCRCVAAVAARRRASQSGRDVSNAMVLQQCRPQKYVSTTSPILCARMWQMCHREIMRISSTMCSIRFGECMCGGKERCFFGGAACVCMCVCRSQTGSSAARVSRAGVGPVCSGSSDGFVLRRGGVGAAVAASDERLSSG